MCGEPEGRTGILAAVGAPSGAAFVFLIVVMASVDIGAQETYKDRTSTILGRQSE
jgi:hypothetical protein